MTILVKGAFDTVEDGIANMIVAANADFEKMYSPDRGQFAVAMNENFKKDWVVKKG